MEMTLSIPPLAATTFVHQKHRRLTLSRLARMLALRMSSMKIQGGRMYPLGDDPWQSTPLHRRPAPGTVEHHVGREACHSSSVSSGITEMNGAGGGGTRFRRASGSRSGNGIINHSLLNAHTMFECPSKIKLTNKDKTILCQWSKNKGQRNVIKL